MGGVKPRPCTECGGTEDVRSYGLCGACVTRRVDESTRAQGLEPAIRDQRVLRMVTAAMAANAETPARPMGGGSENRTG